MTLRLGAVSYLNTRPLTAALEDDRESFELHFDVPSACASDLRNQRVDLGLIPSIEYARNPGSYYIVPDVAIGCRGEVLTVRLFFRGAVEDITSIAVDRSSQTSIALLRILMKERYGLEPTFEPAPPDLDQMLHSADAALLIGDPVLPLVDPTLTAAAPSHVGDRQSLDLGREWVEFSGHPFVFAFWAGKPGAVSPEQVEKLIRARRYGETRVAQIASAFQRARAGSVELYERYLQSHISFEFSDAEIAGLKEFYRLAHRHGLIDSEPELRFFERSTS